MRRSLVSYCVCGARISSTRRFCRTCGELVDLYHVLQSLRVNPSLYADAFEFAYSAGVLSRLAA